MKYNTASIISLSGSNTDKGVFFLDRSMESMYLRNDPLLPDVFKFQKHRQQYMYDY